ncbi:hypothetical protein, partial [Vagococcus salmoninarum]|uniref:hypothetical protein n=1 Tax=Vagococcus salmoninarum TaxID=2739 RepID=UPI003F9A22F5
EALELLRLKPLEVDESEALELLRLKPLEVDESEAAENRCRKTLNAYGRAISNLGERNDLSNKS